VAGFVAEPFASSVIYPASMAAWLFLALFFAFSNNRWIAVLAASVVCIIGCAATILGARRIRKNQEEEDRLLKLLRERGPIALSQLRYEHKFKHPSATVRRLRKRSDIDIVEDKGLLLLDGKRQHSSRARGIPRILITR
jgi:hypothetical protein